MFDHPWPPALRTRTFLPLLLAVAAPAAGAEDVGPEGAEIILDPITTIAYRQPRTLSEVAGTVTIIDPERLDRDVVIEPSDLVRYEPGVELDGDSTRFSFGGFRIRGIGGNRTAVMIDNVPAADRFAIGSYTDSGRGLMDLGLVSHVEILRGPASTLYGSKALGGVVAISMLDTEDVLEGRDRGGRVGVAGGTDADRVRLSAAGAVRRGDHSLLVAGAGQQSGAVNVANPPDAPPSDVLKRRQEALLIRGVRETGGGRIRLTLDGVDESRETDVRASLGSGRLVNATSLEGDDRRKQWRILLDQEFGGAGRTVRGHWRFWHQETDILQKSYEERANLPTPVDQFRQFHFRQDISGIGVDLETRFEAGHLDHRIGYGFELSHADLTERRDALQTNRNTGDTTSVVLGERFPLRDFPLTRITELGVYVHDEIRLRPGGPRLIPGIRFEYYELDGRRDPLYDAAFPDTEITDLQHTAWMPKLGLVWPVSENLDYFAQYATGFRAPPFDDVNIGLDVPMFNSRAIPNPDLKPEKGQSFETGLRWRSAGTYAELVVFRNDYRNFIESRAALGPDPDTGTLLFQSVNRERVHIEGLELRLSRALPGDFNAEAAAEWLRGEDRGSGRPLPEVGPPKMVLALEYAPSPRWDVRLVTTMARGQRALTDANGNPLFSPPGYTVADLIGRWRPRHDLQIVLGLFNVTDETYWRAASVTGRPPDDPMLPHLAEPGRALVGRMEWMF